MGNEQSVSYNERDMPKKVMKWRAELEHVRELNKMLTSERKIVVTNMEQELYEVQLKLYYLGKSATKHIGFRGYLKIINKVTPKQSPTDLMAKATYDPNKKMPKGVPPNQTTAMVLKSAILNFSLFSLFEAWLLKRMHFVSIQKHQRRLHQKGWKHIVAFYSEEIPMIQETFAKQEPGLREKVQQGIKENTELLEEYETMIFQQEEEIIALRRMIDEMGIIDNSGRRDNLRDSTLDKAFPGDRASRGGGGKAAQGFADFRSKAMTPVQAMILKKEREKATSGQRKAWRADNNRTWGAPDTGSEDESLYMDDEILHTDQVIKFGTNDKIEASERHDHVPPSSGDNLKGPEIVYTNCKSDMSAITIPNTVTRSDESTNDSTEGSVVKANSPKVDHEEAREQHQQLALDESLRKKLPDDAIEDLQTLPSTTTSAGSDAMGGGGGSSGGGNNNPAAAAKKKARDKDAIRLEFERLEKAKVERRKRASQERQERESFYKQERERLKHQERRLTMKRDESTRIRQERTGDRTSDPSGSGNGDHVMENSGHQISVSEFDDDIEEDLKDEPLDSLREMTNEYYETTTDDEGKLSTSDHDFEKSDDDDDSDVLQERRPRRDLRSDNHHDAIYRSPGANVRRGEEEEEEEGGEDTNEVPLKLNSAQHPSMLANPLTPRATPKMDRRKMWMVDKAESDRELSCDGDSVEHELKRLSEFETVINASDDEEIAASNISSDFKLLRSSSGRNLVEQGGGEHHQRARSRGPGRTSSFGSKGSKPKGRRTAAKDTTTTEVLKPLSSASLDASNRSKQSKSKSRRKLKDHLLDLSVQSDDISTFSGSRASKGSRGTKKKKKKSGEYRRKLKDLETASCDEDGKVVTIKKKKRRSRRNKPRDDDSKAEYYSGDDDKSITSALTTNSDE